MWFHKKMCVAEEIIVVIFLKHRYSLGQRLVCVEIISDTVMVSRKLV